MKKDTRPSWEELAEKCDDALNKVRLTKAGVGGATREDYRRALRDFWKEAHAIIETLGTELVLGNFQRGDLEEPDIGLLHIGAKLLQIASCIDGLSLGAISDMIEDARMTGGGRPTLRGERMLIAKAVFYLQAVKKGDIADNAPIKTVALAYGVTKQAVRGWRDKGDTYCAGVLHPHPNLIEEAMRHAGEKYKAYGRGTPYKERPRKG